MNQKPDVPIADRVLLRVPEASVLLGISSAECYRLIASGRLRSVMLGSRRRITREAVNAFAAELTAEADAMNARMRRVALVKRKG